jgi:hypothetical protein
MTISSPRFAGTYRIQLPSTSDDEQKRLQQELSAIKTGTAQAEATGQKPSRSERLEAHHQALTSYKSASTRMGEWFGKFRSPLRDLIPNFNYAAFFAITSGDQAGSYVLTDQTAANYNAEKEVIKKNGPGFKFFVRPWTQKAKLHRARQQATADAYESLKARFARQADQTITWEIVDTRKGKEFQLKLK